MNLSLKPELASQGPIVPGLPALENEPSLQLNAAVEICKNCLSACLETIFYCQQMEGALADTKLTNLLLDCAEVCEATIRFILRGSLFYRTLSCICANTCERCAGVFERFSGDRQMLECAQACRACATSFADLVLCD